MEIHALKLSVTEEELNEIAAGISSSKSSVQNLRVRITPEGIVVLGDYPMMMMNMGFETLWEVKGHGSSIEAHLASIKVSGVPAGMLRKVLMKTLRDLLIQEPGVRVEEESIVIDLRTHSAVQMLHLRIHLTAVRCSPGNLVIEAGSEKSGEWRVASGE